MQKTLLIVGSVPGSNNVGQILLREMLQHIKSDDCIIASLLDEKEQPNYCGLHENFKVRVLSRPDEQAKRAFSGRVGSVAAFWNRVSYYDHQIRVLADEVQAYADQQGVQRVWAILNMTSVIDVVYQLASRLTLPLLTHVWDDVHHLCAQRQLDALTRRRTASRVKQLLQQSQKTAVICEAMENEYSQLYAARCKIIRHGVTDQVVARNNEASPHEFRIGFSGGMYCHGAWKALLEALALLQWKITGKPIKFVVMSPHVWFSTSVPSNIEYLGWRSTEEVLEKLANCDLLYMPQSFSSTDRPLTRLSFPTKLSAYVSTGRPIFIHTPHYSSLATFYNQYPLGALCTSIEPGVVAQKICELTENSEAYQNAAQRVAHVAEHVLSRQVFMRQVQTFLDSSAVSSNQLAYSGKSTALV